MFIQNDNDVEIVDLLTDLNIRFENFDRDMIFSFYQDDNYNLLLFTSKENDKGFNLFTINDVKNNLNDLELLKSYFEDLVKIEQLKWIAGEALKQIDVQIMSVKAVKIFK